MQPKIAIVILNWNGSKYLRQFLPSVLGSTYPNKEIIVADNASTDDSVRMLEEHFPNIRVIPLGETMVMQLDTTWLSQMSAPTIICC